MLTSSHRTTNSTGPSSAASSSLSLLPSSNPRKRSRSPSSSKSPHPSRRTGSPFINHITSSPPRTVATLPIQVETTSTPSVPSVIVPSSPNPSPSSSLPVQTITQENPISPQRSTEGLNVKKEVEEASLEVERREGDAEVLPLTKASLSSSAAEASKEGEQIVEANRREDRETSTRPASPMSGVESSSESSKAETKVCERCKTQNVPCVRQPTTKQLDPSRPVVSATAFPSSRTDTPPPFSSTSSTPNNSTSSRCDGCVSANKECIVDGVASRSRSDAATSSRPVASFAHRLPSPPATSTDVSDRPHLNGPSPLTAEERWTQEKRSLTDRVGWLEGEVARLSQGQERLLKMLEAGEKRKSKKLKVSPLGASSEGPISSSLPNGGSTPVAPPGDLLGKHHLPSLSRPSSSSSSINGSAPTSRRPSFPQPNSSASLTFTLPPSTTPLPSALAALPPAPFRRPVPIHHRALPGGAKEDPYNRSRHTQSPHSYPPPAPLQTQPRRASEIDQPRRSSEHEHPSSHPRRNSPPDLHQPQQHLHQPPPLRNSPASWFPGASSSPFGAGASASSSSSSSRYAPPSRSWSSAPPPPLNRGGPPDGNWNPPPAFSRAPFGGNEHRRGSGDIGYSTSSVATPPPPPPLHPSVLQHSNTSSRGAPALPPGFLSSPASRTTVSSSSPALSPKHSSPPPPPPTTSIVPPTTISPPFFSSRSPLPSASSHSIASLLSASGTSSALDKRRKSFTGIGAGFQESSVRGGGEEDAVEDEEMEMDSPPRGGDERRVAGKEMRV